MAGRGGARGVHRHGRLRLLGHDAMNAHRRAEAKRARRAHRLATPHHRKHRSARDRAALRAGKAREGEARVLAASRIIGDQIEARGYDLGLRLGPRPVSTWRERLRAFGRAAKEVR